MYQATKKDRHIFVQFNLLFAYSRRQLRDSTIFFSLKMRHILSTLARYFDFFRIALRLSLLSGQGRTSILAQ